ncbi:MAG: twin-arginine translocase subunit TatC, partial [Phycisphaerae bacterium]|nr:twin-arginine translocase subunit TatC [Phycisphaerae bacterium]
MLKPIIDRRNQDAVMGLGEHLEELRRRVAWSLAVLVPVFVGLFAYSQRLLELLLKPMREALLANGLPGQILATGAVETFLAATVVAGVGTLVVCSPWMVYQAWRFVAPGLYGHERRFAYILAPLSAVLSGCAVAFMYFVMLPVLLAFLVAYSAGVGSGASATAAVPEGVVLPMVPALDADPAAPQPGQMWFNRTLHELRLATAGEDGTGVVVWMTAMAKPTGVVLQPRVNEWVSLFLTMALGFVGAFQMPVVVLLLGW